MKNIVSTISAGVMMFFRGMRAPGVLCLLAPASGIRITTSSRATSGPTAPHAIRAPWPPLNVTSAAMVAGATAPPRKPAKVWIENARPIRASSMCSDRIA